MELETGRVNIIEEKFVFVLLVVIAVAIVVVVLLGVERITGVIIVGGSERGKLIVVFILEVKVVFP